MVATLRFLLANIQYTGGDCVLPDSFSNWQRGVLLRNTTTFQNGELQPINFV